MFKVLGNDGREYGPVDAAVLRQWIHEGRAGAGTQIRETDATTWQPLQSHASFADLFQSPAPPVSAGSRGLPLAVRIIGVATLAAGLFILLRQIGTWSALMQHSVNPRQFPPTFILFQTLALLGVMVRLVSGAGLLLRREWARRLAQYYAVFAIALGLYGLGQTFLWLTTRAGSFNGFTSITFLAGIGFSLVMLGFDGVTILVLRRQDVRAAFGAARQLDGNVSSKTGLK